MKIRLSDAVKQGIVPVGRSKIYDDAAKGKFSWETDLQGKRVADVAELQRVYGPLNTPDSNGHPADSNGQQRTDSNGQSPDANGHPTDTHGLTQTLESENAELKAQLKLARAREDQLLRTNQKLVDMLFDAQADNRAFARQNGKLMLPSAPKKKRWWQRIIMIGI